MQLDETPVGTAKPFGIRAIGERILALTAVLEEVQREKAEAEEEYRRAGGSEEAAFRRETESLAEQAPPPEPPKKPDGERRRTIDRLRDARLARMKAAAGRIRDRLKEELNGASRERESEIDRIRERLSAEEETRRGPLREGVRIWEEGLPRIRERAVETGKVLGEFARLHSVAAEPPEPWRGEVDPDADAALAVERATGTLEDVLSELRRGGRGLALARGGTRILAFILLLGLGGVGFFLALQAGAEPPVLAGILGGVVLVGVALAFASARAGRKAAGMVRDLSRDAVHAAARFEREADVALKRLDELHVECAEEFRAKRDAEEGAVRDEAARATAPVRARLKALGERENKAEWKILAAHGERLDSLDAEIRDELRRRREETDAATRARTDAHEARLSELRKKYDDRVAKLESRRQAALDELSRYAAECREAAGGTAPAWNGVSPAKVVLPGEFPSRVPIADLEVSPIALLREPEAEDDETPAIRLPLTLGFPEQGSLLVRHSGADRDAALAFLTNSMLRVLTAFPPGKARFTIVDPVGLGQSFSAFMHLADHDEALVSGRIWTETPHIEKRLAMLTEHIEKVIQKYLRNRFETIAEYNAEAGELQEPCHFLVVADYPASFSEVAAERLASIVSSGPRCGVYTFLAEDSRLPALPQVDADLLARNGPVIAGGKRGLHVASRGMDRAILVPEQPPSADGTSALLDAIGRQSVDADRVEVPFDAVVPGDGELWSARTTTGVRVPIGRTGAERLQYFDLGRGTAQHALVAGRTGSGKSTLFHVMITNLALWFSPDEIEFYLIDFKKGVEFKPFATHRLPHARVVAIESDREFGLSVLKAVDKELSRRGDLFRRHGVQDLAAFRKLGEEEIVPRTLLLIDEFQEFFTEDDAVARDAALLLDRFVRQGRAFGMHVVLGSQTLSGIYTLARSTLGQMGVRIALQCNETDSYLILSEDNGVARLLTRPGEAIYNDMSGLIEGNNPFQVVWLPEEEEAVHLKRVAAKTAATPGLVPRETVVFEGNLPADLEKNEELLELLEAGVSAGPVRDDRAWLGDPNAIKGPTEVRFPPASGANLLVVGQRRDAAFAMMASSIVSLAAQHRPEDLRIVILDGGGHEPEYADHFRRLAEAMPAGIERFDARTAADAVAELAALVEARGETDDDLRPVYVFAFGLQRLRVLRRGDEFAMPTFGEEEAKPDTGAQFATILEDGPARRVHTVVWSDTLMNLNRTLSRASLREFDMRVLFQMSAADSSELVDSSAANNLGLYNALLAIESDGTFEKFRPYAIPRIYPTQR